MLTQIISGGQSGADRAALDFALAAGSAHGGWCPAGRWAEDGRLPRRYRLRETPSGKTRQRTAWNVRDSDATLVVTLGPPRGGTLETLQLARALDRPRLHVCIGPEAAEVDAFALEVRRFVARHGVRRLNVAGPRASEEPGIYRAVRQLLEAADLR